MERTTIVIPKDLRERAQRLARERGLSMAEFIRQALEDKVKAHPPKPRSLAMGTSGRKDTARRASDLYKPDPWR